MKALARVAAPAGAAALARLLVLAASLALFATLAVRPVLDPSGARAMGTLPACRYDDVLTTPRQYSDWAITLVDTILRVTKSYVPPDLVDVSQAGIAGKAQIRALVIEDLRAMSEAAAAAAAGVGVESAYRTYDEQQTVFDGWVARFGYDRALQVSARPGHSEHQLGLAIDFRSDPGGSPFNGNWGTTPAGKWMKAHAWEYGFVMSYPKDKMAVTCYDFEPWHFRYVGRDLAALIHASGLTPREYLWANFTTTIVPPPPATPGPTRQTLASPVPSVAPSPTAIPTPSATPSAIPTASPVPSPAATPPTTAPTTAAPAPTATEAPIVEAPGGGPDPGLLAAGGVAGAAIAIGVGIALRRRRP